MISIYVGNLRYGISEEQIQSIFEQYGTVHSVKIVKDPVTGKQKGFGFVRMDRDNGLAAIEALDNNEFEGRNLRVNEAKEKHAPGERPPMRNRERNGQGFQQSTQRRY